MNKIIEHELKKCRVAPLPQWEEGATHIFIPKLTVIRSHQMLPNHLYLIKIKPSVKHDTALAANWNNNRYPVYTYYKVEKLTEVGQMIKVNGIGYDPELNQDLLTASFYGFLPSDGFEVVQEV